LCSSRKKEIVKPRQIAMYLLRKELKSSFPFIGRKFGGRDHTTALYAVSKISKQIGEKDDLREELEIIKQSIYKV
jgi:chromosomal replication initiator protein